MKAYKVFFFKKNAQNYQVMRSSNIQAKSPSDAVVRLRKRWKHDRGFHRVEDVNTGKTVLNFQKSTIHIMYTYKGKFHQSFKNWSFQKAEEVLERIGATYWEIG